MLQLNAAPSCFILTGQQKKVTNTWSNFITLAHPFIHTPPCCLSAISSHFLSHFQLISKAEKIIIARAKEANKHIHFDDDWQLLKWVFNSRARLYSVNLTWCHLKRTADVGVYLEESEQTLIKKIKGIAFSFVVVCFSLVFFWHWSR